jgi:DHA2 family lincomycin resistance protein-like MFS transporter
VANKPQDNLPTARVQVAHPYLALMGLYLGGFTGMYSETALNIALPQLSMAFGVELALTQWLVIGYMLVIGLVLPFSSLLMKWFPAKRITMFALCAFLVGALISGFAPSFGVALAGRAIQGIGTGLVLPLMFSMVMEVIPPHKIGSAMGVNALVIMTASAIGPTLAGILVGAFSWRAIFFSFAVVLIVAMFFTLKFSVNPYQLTRPHIDGLSVITSCLGFGGIVFGSGVASLWGWGSVPTVIALVVGVISLVIYVRRQLGMDTPIINLNIFRARGFRIGSVCVMLNFGVTLSLMFILPQFYQNALGLSATFAGMLMLPGGIVNLVVSVLAGNLYDRIGARIPGLAGFALSTIGAILLMFAGPETSYLYIVGCHIILMVGIPLAMSPCQTYALSSLPPQQSPDGSTMMNTMQQVLGAVATAVATFLLATGQSAYFAAGGTASNAAFSEGAHMGFIFALIMVVIALLLATQIKSPKAQAAAAATAPQGQTAAPANAPATAAASSASVANGATLLTQLMTTPVYTLHENDSALDALKLFADKGISGAPVVDANGKLTGFVSDGDIIGTMSRQSPAFTSYYAFVVDTDSESYDERLKALNTTAVGQLATRDVLTVNADDDMRDVCTLLAGHHLKKAPVMDGDKMVGIINRSNITRHAVDHYLS